MYYYWSCLQLKSPYFEAYYNKIISIHNLSVVLNPDGFSPTKFYYDEDSPPVAPGGSICGDITNKYDRVGTRLAARKSFHSI